MYGVSDEYKTAMHQAVQRFRLTGTVGSTEFTDENILYGSFSITNQCSGDDSSGTSDDTTETTETTTDVSVDVSLPVSWTEDGQAVCIATFELNDTKIEIHQPVETWHSGKHTFLLYYPIEDVTPNYTNTFNVYLRMTGGTGDVDIGGCLASISGQGHGSDVRNPTGATGRSSIFIMRINRWRGATR